ncbi:MAG: hypothetical protein MUF27_18070 [Acidobacteria bacterium]|nr:hypothetical protein [Acidobacteriota bacterium]
MTPPLQDTSPEAEAVLVAGWRARTPAEKLALVSAMTRTAQELSLAGIRARHPHATEDELRLRLAALRLPRELMIRLFGWDPAVEGY